MMPLSFQVPSVAAMTLLLIGLSSVVTAEAGQNQETVPEGPVTSLALGSLPSAPGNQVFVPVMLTASEGARIGTVLSEITFPSTFLSFDGITVGQSADRVKAQISAVVAADDQNPESSIIEVSVVSSQGKAIPSGVLAYLAFTIALDAPLNLVLNLENVASARSVDDPENPANPITARNGEIEVKVTDNPFFACLFYMH